MSDRVALDGRSTCDKCLCGQNACKPFLKHIQAHLAPQAPDFEL